MLRAVAQRHAVPVLYCNLVGGNDELIFDGNSLAFDASGHLIATGAAFAEKLALVDLDSPVAIQPEPVKPAAALHDALVLGLRDYTRKCSFKSAVLGLSGGIDSAVTACLAVAALGAEHVMGVYMPSQFSSQGSIDDARDLAHNLGIRWETIAIQNVFEQFKVTLQALFKG
jgi:asparagine synthetase B (glutamine-hydrolysing)